MSDEDGVEQQSGPGGAWSSREPWQPTPRSDDDRVSFGEILRNVDGSQPIPGPYTLAPPDVVPVANELAPTALARVSRWRRRERAMKAGAVLLSMAVGAVLGLVPTRPVDVAPPGAFSEAEITAEVGAFGLAGAQDWGVDPVANDSVANRPVRIPEHERRSSDPQPPQVVRLAPIHVETRAVEPAQPSQAAAADATVASARQARVTDQRSGVTGDTHEERPPAVRRRVHEEPLQAKSGEPEAVAASPAAPQAGAPRAAERHGKVSELPDTPSRADVRDALVGVQDRVRACAPQYRGATVPARITFVSSGRVTTALVSGTLAGTPEGSCVARALRQANVPEFAEPRLVVDYPLQL